MKKYRIHESVGTGLQQVHSYEDLEVHHPSKKGKEPGRSHANIEGEREEVLKTRTASNHHMVSKDFILTDSESRSSRVHVPAPVSGYVGRVDHRNGLVAIYDRKGGELVAQIRHMDLRDSGLKEGEQVAYGQPLGLQGGFGGGNPRAYGTHVHIDFNEQHLDKFKQYLRDIDTGVITPDSYPGKGQVIAPPAGSIATRAQATVAKNDNALAQGEQGRDVHHLQQTLHELGYTGAKGHSLNVDGAVRAFQQAHGLHVDGVVGKDTREALAKAERTPLLSEKTHPNYPLFHEAQQGLRQLPPSTFRNAEELSNTAAALAQKARENSISRIDHVLMNTRGDGVFAVQGNNPQDPARHLVSVDKAQATAQSVERSTELLATQDASRLHSAQIQTQMQHQEHRSGLSMAMRP